MSKPLLGCRLRLVPVGDQARGVQLVERLDLQEPKASIVGVGLPQDARLTAYEDQGVVSVEVPDRGQHRIVVLGGLG